MKRRTKSTKIPVWVFIVGSLALGGLLMYGYLFIETSIGYGKLNPSNDYTIYVNPEVINTLNSEYNPNLEQIYCITGTRDDVYHKVIITNITPLSLKSQAYAAATTSERFACSTQLGLLHTHPKYLGIFPTCEFSETDIYSLGESFGNSKMGKVDGVYCDKDKIAFYISNTETNEEIFTHNQRIGYYLY